MPRRTPNEKPFREARLAYCRTRIQIAGNQQHDHRTSGRNSTDFRDQSPHASVVASVHNATSRSASRWLIRYINPRIPRLTGNWAIRRQENDLRRFTRKRGQRQKEQVEKRRVVIKAVP